MLWFGKTKVGKEKFEINDDKIFWYTIMLWFGKTKVGREKFYGAKKKKKKRKRKICNVDVDNIVISKLAKMKNISKYLLGSCYKTISFDIT